MSALSPDTTAALRAVGLDVEAVRDLAERAVAEDLAGGVDVTSVATVPGDLLAVAAFVPRAAGVVAGRAGGDGRASTRSSPPSGCSSGATATPPCPGSRCSRCAGPRGHCSPPSAAR